LLMRRRPPRSTLAPCTTLFRSVRDGLGKEAAAGAHPALCLTPRTRVLRTTAVNVDNDRVPIEYNRGTRPLMTVELVSRSPEDRDLLDIPKLVPTSTMTQREHIRRGSWTVVLSSWG